MTQSIMNVAAAQERASRTKLEAFAASDGFLRIAEHYPLMPPKMRYGKSEATLIRVRNTRSDEVFIGLKLVYISGDDPQRQSSAVLDGDELQSLSSAVRYIVAHQAAMTTAAETYTEVTYKSRGGLEAGFYISDDKKVGEYIVLDGELGSLASMKEFSRLVEDAMRKIEQIAGSTLPPTQQS